MNPTEALKQVRDAFRNVPRPQNLFIRGTCRCEECEEHNLTLSSHDLDTISEEELGNPGWDPICMASDQAFLYYLPAMFRLAFEHDGYIYQLLFHLGLPDRLAIISPPQGAALKAALNTWDELHAGSIEEDCYRRYLDDVLRRLDSISVSGPAL